VTVKHSIYGFRICFLITLCAVSYLALTPIEIAVLEGMWDKSNHLVAFITLSFLIDYAVTGYWRKWLGLIGYGVLIEVTQWFSGYRFFELSDIFADSLGISIYLIFRAQFIKVLWLKGIRRTLDEPRLNKTTQGQALNEHE